MSTKTTLLATEAEHWYHDLCSTGGEEPEECVLEFSDDHSIEIIDDGRFQVIVPEGTSLYKKLVNLRVE